MRDPIRDDYWTTLGNQVSAAYTRLSHNPDHNPTTLWGDALRAVLHDTPAQIQSETTYAIAMAAEQRNRADKADRDATQLRELLDITAVHRTDAVIRLINATRRSGGKHDDECWTRHAWCLAERIRDTITGSPQ